MKQIGAMKLFAMSLVHCEDVVLSTEDLNLKQIKLYESIEECKKKTGASFSIHNFLWFMKLPHSPLLVHFL